MLKLKRKLWSVLVAVCMTVAFMPTVVMAAGGEASVNGVEYATLKEALEVGGNVELLKDVEVDSIINVTNPTVLDLGDYTITNKVENERPICVNTDSFTIIADKGGMVIPEENTNAFGFIKVEAVSDFTINGGNYTGNTNNGAFFRFFGGASGANIELNDLTVTTNNDVFYVAETFDTVNMQVNRGTYEVDTRAFLVDVYDYENSPVVFNGVTITANRGPCIEMSGANTTLIDCTFTVIGDFTGGYTWARSAVGIGYEGRATIKSGTYMAKGPSMKTNEGYGVYIYSSGGEVNIEGGTFAGTTASLKADVDKNSYGSPAVIHVGGGHFDGDILATTNTGLESIIIDGGEFTGITEKTTSNITNSVSVSGGSFNLSMKDFVENEIKYELQNNGRYAYYPTLQEAIEDADSEAIITAIDDGSSADSYTATLVYNDGTNKTVQVIAETDGKIALPVLNRTGYLFLGWNDGTCSVIEAGEVYTLTSNTTLTAQWKELTKIKIEAKKPSCTEDGNIEYWYCPELNQYFSDEALTQTIDLVDTVLEAKGHNFVGGKCTVCGKTDMTFDPVIIEGANSVYNGEAEGLTFCSNADFDDFLRVMVDGNEVVKEHYIVQEGSIIVTLKKEYLNTLSEGKHTLTIVSVTGEATTEFTIVNNGDTSLPDENKPVIPSTPNTGDNSNTLLWITIALLSGMVLSGSILYKRKQSKLSH